MEWTRKGVRFKQYIGLWHKIVSVWSQFILESGLRMASDDSNHDIQCDKGDDQPADDQGGLHEGALQPLMLIRFLAKNSFSMVTVHP